MLLKLVRDKGFERLVKIEKGKNTGRIRMINARHQSSLRVVGRGNGAVTTECFR